MVYLDTSVLVALFIPEAHSAKAQRALSRQTAVGISALTEVEFSSALARRVRTGDIDADTARRIDDMFRLQMDNRAFVPYPVESRDYDLARRWLGLFSTPLRTLDALHLAVAFHNDLMLMTADVALAASAKHLGVPAKLLFDARKA